ncbi:MULTISPECIES: TetR/AcrR family transcriptional regulator [Dyella]|uniref:TetR/AcrR family transcriptional regulator n=2 Tax=Dyella TaxID=231454 RepID=A0A4R0Z0Y9_9GAMM|nr:MULTISPECIES: TetR/AcrR family transcriptional regulator [Dyella]TBR38979.1 TetR/AcrR family transcriptional regulator [Dyella terrae]TCI13429.1 TetR/AcrR family transcriptional regulator [Dyella soli]
MPLSAAHKQKTRDRIVECARELFNRRGFAEVSIDEIMQRAGLTRGGFYNHFRAKEELFAEAIAAYQNFDATQRWKELPDDVPGCMPGHARFVINAYLSDVHLNDIEGHCPMIALPSDSARSGPVVRQAYHALLERMVGMLSNDVDPADHPQARERGVAAAALLVGAMVLARTVEDATFCKEIRDAARKAALDLVD